MRRRVRRLTPRERADLIAKHAACLDQSRRLTPDAGQHRRSLAVSVIGGAFVGSIGGLLVWALAGHVIEFAAGHSISNDWLLGCKIIGGAGGVRYGWQHLRASERNDAVLRHAADEEARRVKSTLDDGECEVTELDATRVVQVVNAASDHAQEILIVPVSETEGVAIWAADELFRRKVPDRAPDEGVTIEIRRSRVAPRLVIDTCWRGAADLRELSVTRLEVEYRAAPPQDGDIVRIDWNAPNAWKAAWFRDL